ncbi:MAG TPA: hypothetical protein VI874_04625 [Candidatus Norongarragalinales archaeon]|nr:hypothetical protein [Candidatus Norongarragalinales archaeon]
MKIPYETLGVAMVVFFSMALTYNGLMQDASYLLPSYDNALLHTGRVHYVIDTGLWIPHEMVFGGVTPSYHVPAYASFTAALAKLSGLNYLWAVRLVALLFSALMPLGFYLLGKRLSNWQACVAAAFFALNSTGLMTWGTRTSAISLGVLLVVYLLYFLLEKRWFAALAGSVVLAMTHPPSLLVFFGTAGLYTLFRFAKEKTFSIDRVKKHALDLPFVAAMAGFFSYMAWHISLTKTSCLTFKCLPQLGSREYGSGVDVLAKATAFPYGMGFLGLSWLLFTKEGFEKKALVLAFFLSCLLLVKNELFGIGVFTERFVTFLEEALAVLGGLFVGLMFERFEHKPINPASA